MRLLRFLLLLIGLTIPTCSIGIGLPIKKNEFKPIQIAGNTDEIKNYLLGKINVENQNWAISQDPVSGFIYFANDEGLIEYDGLSTNIYPMPYNKVVRSVSVDPARTIFTGGFEDFGYWQKSTGCKMQFHSLAKLTQIEPNDEIWKIYTQHGKIYFQSFTTIYVYDHRTIKKYKAHYTLLFMFPAEQGFFVQILENGLYLFKNENYQKIPGGEIFANIKIHSMVPYIRNSYLIGTANNGLYIYDGRTIRPFQCEVSEFLKYNTCNAGMQITDSLYVFGTILNGIVECNQDGRIIKTYNYTNGLKNNTVLSLFKDRDQGLWVGLDQGANYLEVLSPLTQYTNVTGNLGTIYTLLQKKDILYLGTNQGLFTARVHNNNYHYSFSDIRMIPESQGQVWTLKEFDNQVLCGHNEGTFLVDNGNFRQISSVTGGWTIKPIRNYLIEGTYTGLVVYQKDNKGKWTLKNKVLKFNEPSRHVEVDYIGYVWVSHPQRGIYKIELNENLDSTLNWKLFRDLPGIPNNLDVFKINNRIVFTSSERIYTYNYDEQKIVPFTSLNKQLNEFSKAALVIPYENNQYWLVCDSKMALFEISREFKVRKIMELNLNNIHTPGNDLELVKMDSKNILFPNHKGFMVFNQAQWRGQVSRSRIILNRIRFQGKGETRELCQDGHAFTVPYFLNNITVYFSDPGRFNQEQKVFYYRIRELEDQWHSTMVNNFNYNNIRFGNYTIEIQTDLNGNITAIPFTILAPWYLTRLAFVIYFIVFLSLLYLGHRIFQNELRKQKKMVEMELKRNSLENELDVKSNELLLTMRYLIQKNEILTELKTEIDALKELSSKYPMKQVKNLEKIINQGLDTQTESWKSAMNNLKLSQQGFFRKLKDKHPDLTPNDLRLCSYLRMNFNSKEIAHLLNISGRGVEIGRYRLRKKMNLPHDVNLSEYLMAEEFGNLTGKGSIS